MKLSWHDVLEWKGTLFCVQDPDKRPSICKAFTLYNYKISFPLANYTKMNTTNFWKFIIFTKRGIKSCLLNEANKVYYDCPLGSQSRKAFNSMHKINYFFSSNSFESMQSSTNSSQSIQYGHRHYWGSLLCISNHVHNYTIWYMFRLHPDPIVGTSDAIYLSVIKMTDF